MVATLPDVTLRTPWDGLPADEAVRFQVAFAGALAAALRARLTLGATEDETRREVAQGTQEME